MGRYKGIINKTPIGEKFGRLTVLEDADDYVSPSGKNKMRQCICLCDCGNICTVRLPYLVMGKTKSCGCYHRELASKQFKKYNNYEFYENYGIGYTANGENFYFDLEDYDKIKDICWGMCSGYVMGIFKNEYISLHRFVMNCPKDKIVDHINRNKLDNRKENLRICNIADNAINKSVFKQNKTGYNGVYFRERTNKYEVYLGIKGKNKYLGSYINIEDAVVARLKAEKEYSGDFAPQRNLFIQYGIEVDNEN